MTDEQDRRYTVAVMTGGVVGLIFCYVGFIFATDLASTAVVVIVGVCIAAGITYAMARFR